MSTYLSTYRVTAPATPGAQPSVIGQFPTLAAAREAAERFESRRDLRYHDVRIETLRAGPHGPMAVAARVEFAGPCR